MKCAIYGAGSLGTVLGAYMTKNGQAVELVNHSSAHVEALQLHGAHITGPVDFTVPVTAILPAQMEGPYDVIFLMTKQQHNREVVTQLKPLLSENGVIVTMQNGLPEPLIEEIVGPEHTMGCVVEWGARLTAPGVSLITCDLSVFTFRTAKPKAISTEMFEAIKSMLELMCPVYVEEDLAGVRWSKLLINAAFAGIGTIMGTTFGGVADDKQARTLVLRCIKEVIDVGHAAGVKFVKIQGVNITSLFYCNNAFKEKTVSHLIPIAMRKHYNTLPSMLQDYQHGKPCEIDFINGAVCDWGRKVGVPTPINDRIVRIIKNIEAGKLRPEKLNLVLFSDLL